ncbi:MAG: tRNA epoxyqueuosine(34) reductase QueG [Planctomycetota bacterium]
MNAGDASSDTVRIIDRCTSLGFALAGVTPLLPTAHEEALRQWIADGKHGEMGYLAEHLEARLDPNLVLDGARSAVIVADLYQTRGEDEAAEGTGDDAARVPAGRVARYAKGRDYHDTIKRRLRLLCDELRTEYPRAGFRVFSDTAPVLERELAARAGIGWTGKHGLVIHPELGSWMLLGGILTTLDLEPPAEQRGVDDHCGTCTRCIDACPTDAITPRSMDATRCISYLTIEHRSPIDPGFFEAMGDWVAGCDICQEVCPHNSPRPARDGGGDGVRRLGRGPDRRHPDYEPTLPTLPLIDVIGWTAEYRSRVLRGSALKRIKLDMFRRNALIAAANEHRSSPDARLLAAISSAADDESPLVSRTARDLLRDLGSSLAGPQPPSPA